MWAHSASSSGPGLEQDRVADADLADVVQERAELEGLEAVGRIAGLLGQDQRVGRDPTAVALGVRILGLDRLGQAEQRLAVGLLELERSCPRAPWSAP
jgi:hypothetical protein